MTRARHAVGIRASSRPTSRTTSRTSGRPRTPATPAADYRVRELDPVAKCGPATSVERLYRIDERTPGTVRTHLVFLDRHGWYCEHGADCPAVAQAKRAARR